MRVKILSERPMGKRVKKYLRSIGEQIVEKDPEILVVAYYSKILKKEEYSKQPTVNFHPGYLPFNKGMYPHVWPVFDGSQAGVTIHYITDVVDGGPIIGQKKLKVKFDMTAGEFEKITQDEIFNLFIKVWPKIKAGYGGVSQEVLAGGSHHFAREIINMQEFDKKTIRRLAACTFADRSYGYFIDKGKKYYVGVKFFTEKDIKEFDRNNHG